MKEYNGDGNTSNKNYETFIPYLNKSGKYLYVDSESMDTVLYGRVFDDAQPFNNELAIIKLNGKYGCVNKEGHEIVPAIYDSIYLTRFDSFQTTIKAKKGLINNAGKVLIQPKYDLYTDFNNLFEKDLVSVSINDKNGRKHGIVSRHSGEEVIKPIYDNAFSFQDGLAAIKINNKYGYINLDQEVVIAPKYDYAWNFDDGLAKVKTDELGYGFINMEGEVIIPLQYDELSIFREGLARVVKNKKVGFIDKQGNEVIKLVYDSKEDDNNYREMHFFYEGIAAVRQNNLIGFIDTHGDFILPPLFDDAFTFLDDRFVNVVKNNKGGFYDRKLRILIPPVYDRTGYFQEGKVSVELEMKQGFINESGIMIIPPIYDDVGRFSEGMVSVEMNYKVGFIDESGILKISQKYCKEPDRLLPEFEQGFARVLIRGENESKPFYINKIGEEYREK